MFFFFKQKTAYEIEYGLVGPEMCIRDGGSDGTATRERSAILAVMRRWDHNVTSPAMILAWAMGFALGTMGGWFSQRWFLAKIAIVLALSMLHGLLSGRLRKIAIGQQADAASLQYAPWLVVLAMSMVVGLVVLKPF